MSLSRSSLDFIKSDNSNNNSNKYKKNIFHIKCLSIMVNNIHIMSPGDMDLSIYFDMDKKSINFFYNKLYCANNLNVTRGMEVDKWEKFVVMVNDIASVDSKPFYYDDEGKVSVVLGKRFCFYLKEDRKKIISSTYCNVQNVVVIKILKCKQLKILEQMILPQLFGSKYTTEQFFDIEVEVTQINASSNTYNQSFIMAKSESDINIFNSDDENIINTKRLLERTMAICCENKSDQNLKQVITPDLTIVNDEQNVPEPINFMEKKKKEDEKKNRNTIVSNIVVVPSQNKETLSKKEEREEKILADKSYKNQNLVSDSSSSLMSGDINSKSSSFQKYLEHACQKAENERKKQEIDMIFYQCMKESSKKNSPSLINVSKSKRKKVKKPSENYNSKKKREITKENKNGRKTKGNILKKTESEMKNIETFTYKENNNQSKDVSDKKVESVQYYYMNEQKVRDICSWVEKGYFTNL